jgi:flagellar assembly protein FliH
MTPGQVVLRHLAVDDMAALPARGRAASPPVHAVFDVALKQAQEEGVRHGHEEGLRAGYEEGLLQGRAAAQAEVEAMTEALESAAATQREERQAALGAALAAFEDAKAQWLALAEEDMVALCFETLGRILADAVAPEVVRAQASHLLAHWRGQGVPILRASPADVRLLEGLQTDLPFACVADPDVKHGGFLVQGGAGALDARLDRILEEVKASLLAARQGPMGRGAA